jgi:hypothetical protein
MEIRKAPDKEKVKAKLSLLTKMYLIHRLTLAKDSIIAFITSDKSFNGHKELYADKKKSMDRIVIFYNQCIRCINKNNAVPRFVVRTTDAFIEKGDESFILYENNASSENFNDIFPEKAWNKFKELMVHIWGGKTVSCTLEDGCVTFMEDETPVISSFLNKDHWRDLLAIHCNKESQDFFIWVTKNFNMKSISSGLSLAKLS